MGVGDSKSCARWLLQATRHQRLPNGPASQHLACRQPPPTASPHLPPHHVMSCLSHSQTGSPLNPAAACCSPPWRPCSAAPWPAPTAAAPGATALTTSRGEQRLRLPGWIPAPGIEPASYISLQLIVHGLGSSLINLTRPAVIPRMQLPDQGCADVGSAALETRRTVAMLWQQAALQHLPARPASALAKPGSVSTCISLDLALASPLLSAAPHPELTVNRLPVRGHRQGEGPR